MKADAKLTRWTSERWQRWQVHQEDGPGTPEPEAPNTSLAVARGALALILAGLVAVAVAAGVALWGPGRPQDAPPSRGAVLGR